MKDRLNERILENVKLKISISNFNKEENVEMIKNKRSIFKSVAVASVAIVSLTGVVFAKDIGSFVKNMFGTNTSEGVDIAINNGYVTEVKTESQKADGIDINVDSMLMDDFNFCMNFNVKLDDKYDIKDFSSIDIAELNIVDETGATVFNTHDIKYDTEEEFREKAYMGSYSILSNEKNNNEFTISVSATGSNTAFPKSKHLTVTFSKLVDRKSMNDVNKEYEGDWHFEIDVPAEFYNRTTTIYRAVECNESGINLNEVTATLSNTALKLYIPKIKTDMVDYNALHNYDNISIEHMIALQKEYVETSDGKKFETSQRSDGDGGYSIPNEEENTITDYKATFNLTQYDATDEITVHVFTNKDKEIILKLKR